MKIIAAGDIHGSAFYAHSLVERISELCPHKVILLGDIYGHSYNRELDGILLSSGIETVSVAGNCDYYTANLSSLDFVGSSIIESHGGRQFFFTHGHIYNASNLPPRIGAGDVFIYGHTHNTKIAQERGINIINAGSVSRPRGGSKKSFVWIENNVIEIREVENGNLIQRLHLE